MTRTLMLAGLGLLAAAGGCTVGPNYQRPDTTALTPTEHAASAAPYTEANPPDRWWTVLDDPLLDELIARAIAGNPDLAAAEARVRQSRAEARAAGAQFYPQLNADASVNRNEISRNGEQLAIVPFPIPQNTFTDYKVGFDASWEFDLAGHTHRQVEAAVARLGSAEELRNQAQLVLAAEVAQDYVQYRLGRARAALAEDSFSAAHDTTRLYGLQSRAGEASEADVARARSDELSAQALPGLRNAEADVALEALVALLAVPRAQLAAELEPDRPVPATAVTPAVGLPSTLLERRPDVRGAERDLAAATADVGVAVADQFPRVSLVGTAGFESVYTGQLISAASRYWSLVPQLSVPVFAGGRLRENTHAAEAARDAALATYRSTVLKAFSDTESALIRYSADTRRAATLAGARDQLAQVHALAQRREAAGDVAHLDVLSARLALDQIADQAVSSTAQSTLDFVSLEKSLGGGWQPQL